LRNEGDAAGARAEMGKARIESDARDDEPDAVRPENAQRMAPRRQQHRIAERAATGGRGFEARAQHHGGARAERAELRDQTRHARRRCADDGEIRRRGQLRDRGAGRQARHRRAAQVDRPHRSPKPAGEDVAHDSGANASGAVGCADDRQRLRRQQVLEVMTAHGVC